MNDEWKYKELPRASGQIAPAQWNPETGEWEVFTGLAKVQDVAVEARLQAIEQTQSQILDKLNDTIDTRLTGSNVEDGIPVNQMTRNTKVMEIDASYDEGVPAGGYRTWDILAPKGWMINEIVDVRMRVSLPEGRSSGDHLLSFGRKVTVSHNQRGYYALTSGRTSSHIIFHAGTGFDLNNDDAFPKKTEQIPIAYRLLSFDDETSIQAYYLNETDVDQNYKIDIRIKCIAEKKVGE